jgi:hypothetical protein
MRITRQRNLRLLIPCLLAALSTALMSAPAAPAATTTSEPNDSILSAQGPLLAGETYLGATESEADKDFFYFYVSSATGAQVSLTVSNLGGSKTFSDVEMTLMDGAATPVGAAAFVRKGESRTLTVSLWPQKYFIEVAPTEKFGDSYSLSAVGSRGAFGPYTPIASRCAKARSSIHTLESELERAKAKLRRAGSRLRRSRYGLSGPKARKLARSTYAKAKARVSSREIALKSAAKKRNPWCFIPQ